MLVIFFFSRVGNHRDLHVLNTLSLHDALPIYVAQDLGLFAEHRVEIVGIAVALDAPQAGALDGLDDGGLAETDEEGGPGHLPHRRSEEHTSELQSLMRISYAVFCLKKKPTCISQQRQNKHITLLQQKEQ